MKTCVIPAILLLTLFCLCCTVTGEENPFEGTWDQTNYTLTLTLNGTGVFGTLDGKDPDLDGALLLYGTVSDNGTVLEGILSSTGTAELAMAEDGMSVSGITTVEPLGSMIEPFVYPFNSTRNGTIADPDSPWDGIWESDFYRYIYMQNGTTVSGTYQPISSPYPINGFLDGTVTENGKNLSLQWVYTENVVFSLSEDGTMLNQTNCIPGDEEQTCLNLVKSV